MTGYEEMASVTEPSIQTEPRDDSGQAMAWAKTSLVVKTGNANTSASQLFNESLECLEEGEDLP